MGEHLGQWNAKTPRAFVNACEVFALTTNLAGEPKSQATPEENGDWTKVVRQAVAASVGEDGWAFLDREDVMVRRQHPLALAPPTGRSDAELPTDVRDDYAGAFCI